jgi:hypothetical protein
VPDLRSLRIVPALLTGVALLLMFGLKQGLARCLGVCAILGALISFLG